MKKKIAVILLVVAMLLSFAGCSTQKNVTLTILEPGTYEVVKYPDNCKDAAFQNGTLTMSVSKYGDYPIVIKGEDNTEYTIVIKYEKGVTTVLNDQLDCKVEMK